MNKTKAEQIIQMAVKNINNKPENLDSAVLCLRDAESLFARAKSLGDLDLTYKYSCQRAIHSLAYSCGIFSLQYRNAMNIMSGTI